VEAGKKEEEEAGLASSKLLTSMQNTIHGLERSGKVMNKCLSGNHRIINKILSKIKQFFLSLVMRLDDEMKRREASHRYTVQEIIMSELLEGNKNKCSTAWAYY
jgi:hypothetical protein